MPVASPRVTFEAPPLIEVVFDLFAVPAPDPRADLADAVFERLPSYDSEPQPWDSVSMHLSLDRGRLVSQGVDVSRTGTRRWDESRTRAVLVGPGVLAYNILPPYGRFEEHARTVAELVELYIDVARPRGIARIGQRYINRVTVDVSESAGEFFTLYPALPKAYAVQHPPVHVRIEAARFDNGVVVTTLGLSRSDANGATYVLDVWGQTVQPPDMAVADVIRWHEEAHAAVVESFLTAITDAARKRFKEQTQ